MAWLKIESSVARNKKFVKAGPAPSWLWVCGIAYCQEGLTDGFIPKEALPYLGVKNSAQLATHLVKAGLWDEAPGGWRVHDYLDHNRSASDVAAIRAARKDGGKLGGRPKKNLPETLKVSRTQTSPVAGSVDDGVAVDDLAMDVCARELVNLAPPEGRCSWHLVESPLFNALTDKQLAPTPRESWEVLKARLEVHKRSHQWRMKGMVKRLDRWLAEGVYLAEPPEDGPAAERLTPRTTRTAAAVAEIMKEPA